MPPTTFLSNETLWQALSERIRAARQVHAAIAYFGQGGAKLLPLGRGDRLIVDMSPSTVRAGATDPREVEKLVRRGVHVFTRRNLHAKLVVADNAVISGSANVSQHSRHVLDEAGILTNSPSAVRRAREFVDRLCTEPVRSEYLQRTKRLYRPPHFNGQRNDRKNRQPRASHAKLWIVNLHDYSVPEWETERYRQGEARAQKLVKDAARSNTDSFHWPYKPRMASELEAGDWIIMAMRYTDKTVAVYPPGQFLLMDSYVRDPRSRKQRYVFHLEVPRRGETIPWQKFRRAARSLLRKGGPTSPRTMAIRDVQVADVLLSLWTPGGRVSRR